MSAIFEAVDVDGKDMDLYCKYECHWKCGESEGGLRLTLKDGFPADEAQEIDGLLSPKDTRALHRYLSALVLPAVERRMLETSRYCGQDKREVVYVSPLGVAASCVGRAVVCGETMMSIEVARAKAACLLAAADEAEGVTPC